MRCTRCYGSGRVYTRSLASTRDADDAAAVAVVELVGRLMRRAPKVWRVLSIARRE